MKEEFLHFVWRTQNFDFSNLRTTSGETVEVIDFGHLNLAGGPDFKQGRLRIDGTLWAGNIEMHLASSDWHRHKHSEDPNYESVILHVVLEDDQPVYINGRRLPCVTLKRRIPAGLLARYGRLMQLRSWIPCQQHIMHVPDIKKEAVVDRMLVERLEEKARRIRVLLDESHSDWDEALYRVIARGFGFGQNGVPFERLSRLLPVRLLYQQGGNLEAIEAMLFGVAGMLNKIFIDDYPARLQKEYNHLSRKYGLQAMDSRAWEWGKVRPANFPTIRIAQFCALLSGGQDLMRDVLDVSGIDVLRRRFDAQASDYWTTHTDFDRPSKTRRKKLGNSSIDRLLINSIVPFMFTYGKHRHNDEMTDAAIDMMHQISPEKNNITNRWSALGMPNHTAGQSQGLLQLKRAYCSNHRCVECSIGSHILLNEKATHV